MVFCAVFLISDVLQLQDYNPYEENPGIAPFSEPETQIMRKLALSFDPHVWINVHSGMEVSCTEFPVNIHRWLLLIAQVFAFKSFILICSESTDYTTKKYRILQSNELQTIHVLAFFVISSFC
jgi:hypothetical protein